MKYRFSEAQINEIKSARKKNRNKMIDRRLRVIEMRS